MHELFEAPESQNLLNLRYNDDHKVSNETSKVNNALKYVHTCWICNGKEVLCATKYMAGAMSWS